MQGLTERIAHYRITASLGAGATGVVFAAEDERLGRAVVVKLLPPGADPDAVVRFKREAQVASALSHPGMVVIHDVGDWEGHAYLVMEHVVGQCLRDHARAGVPAADAVRLCIEIAECLAAAHARGLLHGDLRSDNIMVAAGGRVKLLDFGLAKLLDHDGKPFDVRSEVYALGAVLYELLTGIPPKRAEAVRRPSRVAAGAGITSELDQVVLQALEAERARRIPDMATFAARLRAVHQGAKPRRAPRRILVTAAIVAFSGGLAGAVGLLRRPPTPATFVLGSTDKPVVYASRRLTFDAGCEEYPSFSPDQKWVIYDGWNGEDYELMRLELATGRREQITHAESWDYGATVSPDGKRIAYLHLAEQGSYELRVLPWQGDRTAAPDRLGATSGFPAWTPDGDLVVGRADGRFERLRLGKQGAVSTASVITTLENRLTARSVVALSNDSFAFTRAPFRADRPELVRLDANHSVEVLPSPTLVDGGLALGIRKRFLYSSRPTLTGKGELVAFDLESRSDPPRPVADTTASESGLDVSTDGRLLVTSTCKRYFDIVHLRPGQPPRSILSDGPWQDFLPTPTPHGLLFTSDRAGFFQLWLREKPGARPRVVTPKGGSQATLSPDGKWMAYLSRDEEVVLAPFPEGEPATSLTPGKKADRPRFSRDGAFIFFDRDRESGRPQVHKVSTQGGPIEAVLPRDTSNAIPSPSRDQLVYLRWHEGQREVVTADLDGGHPRVIGSKGFYINPAFSPDGKHVLVVRNTTELVELDADGVLPPRVVWSSDNDVATGDYAPDGDGYLLSLGRWEGDLWLSEGYFP